MTEALIQLVEKCYADYQKDLEKKKHDLAKEIEDLIKKITFEGTAVTNPFQMSEKLWGSHKTEINQLKQDWTKINEEIQTTSKYGNQTLIDTIYSYFQWYTPITPQEDEISEAQADTIAHTGDMPQD